MGLFTPLTILAFVFSSIHSTAPSPFLKAHCGRDLILVPESEGESACLPSAFLRPLTRGLCARELGGGVGFRHLVSLPDRQQYHGISRYGQSCETFLNDWQLEVENRKQELKRTVVQFIVHTSVTFGL